jgi:hypothetical protein
MPASGFDGRGHSLARVIVTMLLSPSVLVQPTSGFVPFSDGGSPVESQEASVVVASRAAADEAEPALLQGIPPVDAWNTPHATSVRRLEAAILLVLSGYFTFGLGKLLGLV